MHIFKYCIYTYWHEFTVHPLYEDEQATFPAQYTECSPLVSFWMFTAPIRAASITPKSLYSLHINHWNHVQTV